MIPVVPQLKTADSAVMREKPIFSPRSASVSEWTLSRILKIKISRDAKQVFGINLLQKSLGIPLVRKSLASYLELGAHLNALSIS